MRKCSQILVAVLLTILFVMMLLIRGLTRGILVSVGKWCSWQLIFVCLILIFILSGLLIVAKQRGRGGKIVLWILLAGAAIVSYTVGSYMKPFSYEQHSVYCKDNVRLILTRPANIKGHVYQVYRQDGSLFAKDTQLEISSFGRFSTDDYDIYEKNGNVVFYSPDAEGSEAFRIALEDTSAISTKEKVCFFLNGYTVIYVALLIIQPIFAKTISKKDG